MQKTLTKHGNSLALVIEKPILDLLKVDINTVFSVVTDGHALILTPITNEEYEAKVEAAYEKVNRRYANVFKKLSE